MILQFMIASALIGYLGKHIYDSKVEQPKAPTPLLAASSVVVPLTPNALAPNEPTEEENSINRKLIVSTTSLGIATVSRLTIPSLGILSAPGMIYAGSQIFQNAYQNAVTQKKLSVEVPLAVEMVTCVVNQYYWIGNLVTFFYSLSRKMLTMVKKESQQSLVEVFQHVPRSAWVMLDNGVEIEMPIQEVKAGDRIRVYAGSAIPVDGLIILGNASIDEHSLTGEAQPAEKGPGDTVFASTVVLTGQVEIRVDKAGEDTVAAQMTQILSNITTYRSEMQLKAENLADKTVTPTFLLAGAAWPFIGPTHAVAIINAHFGIKLSLLAPIGILRFTKVMSQHGILIKDGRVLDLLNEVDTVVFDKTGTLTLEQPHVGQIHCCSTYHDHEILAYAAAAEYKQTHPIAKAILAETQARSLVVPVIADTAYEIGYGVKVNINGQLLKVGSQRFMEKERIEIPAAIATREALSHSEGNSLVMVALDDQVIGAIELVPTLRPEAKAVIQALKQRSNIKSMYLMSGDHDLPTHNLAKQLGIDNYFAEVLPQEKADIIDRLKATGNVVCYIGDGINDAIAMKKAQVSVSVQGASTIAIDSADMVLMSGDLQHISHAFEIAEKLNQTIRNNFILVGIPSIVGISGILFLGLGLPQTVLINQSFFLANLAYSMRPLGKLEHVLKR